MNSLGYAGEQLPEMGGGELNATTFLAQQLISRINTSTLVQVVSCTNSGDLSPVGFVDVQPLVNQLNGAGRAMPHNRLHRLPYFRLQGGTNAVIIDPEPGDIGIAVFADRDISSVSNTKAQANPGSGRRFDMADGMYIGGVLNGTPRQFMRFYDGGIEIVSPTKIRLSAPDIELNADNSIKFSAPTIDSNASASITETAPTITNTAPTIALNGAIVQTGGASGAGGVQLAGPLNVSGAVHSDADVTAQSVSLHGHAHGGVARGGVQTDPPTP